MSRPTWLFCGFVVVMMLMACEPKPTSPPTDMAANGCWVQIFEREKMNTAGAWDVINGPGEFSTLYKLPGARYARWDDRIDSLIVGPHAKVPLWANDYFDDEQLQFGPDSHISALGDYDFEHEPESIKIEYVP
jgi:hypothetical protein